MKKVLVVLLAAALLAGYYFLGTDYLRQRQGKEQLTVETVAAQQALATLPPRPADLDQRLKQALDSQEAARNLLPGRMDTTEAINVILHLAEDSGVKAIPLATQAWITETAGDYAYSIFRFELNVSGEFAAVQAFLSRLESDGPGTLSVEYIRLARPDGQPESGFVEALLQVALYARPVERH